MSLRMVGKVKIIDCIKIRSPNIPINTAQETRIPKFTAAGKGVVVSARNPKSVTIDHEAMGFDARLYALNTHCSTPRSGLSFISLFSCAT